MKIPVLAIPTERIEKAIFLIRGEKVMVDSDLSELYAVETKALNRAVKRNLKRFPEDFMFKLTAAEAATLRCQKLAPQNQVQEGDVICRMYSQSKV